jgi:hypothetical protein
MGDNFTPTGKHHPWGPTSPLRENITPGGENKNRPLGVVLSSVDAGVVDGVVSFSEKYCQH